ncbi:MAG: ATP synthase epsilon chain [candidate division WS6 bacterium GW2011_GWA2_37_6]|uniref:ATP synthase epsilon chain n=1 Tax=candidate division WS6 bacterium GW2011_GWA2_37_6 TaxID=1619087 RepID=A0A0G0K233_9BACT|nr:MAG: ATP synthase epsilon chain [candidate division WS6 bacterium GW2011_GWA2_37_6]
MKVKVVSSAAKLFEEENVNSISLPGEAGQMQILNDHTDIVSNLKIGEVVVKHGENSEKIVINGGLLVFRKNEALVLANEATKAGDLVEAEIDKAIAQAEKKLESELEPSELIQLERILRYEKFKKQRANV